MLYKFAGSVSQPFIDLWNRIIKTGPKWLVAFVILFVAWLAARIIKKLVQKTVGRTSTQGHVDILIARGVAALILTAGIILALSEVGMSLSAALATVGLASVGIGFAMQDILSNLFAGVILLVQHPFTIGDQIKVADQEGIVENIRVRDTQILTYEGERVFIPNRTVFSNPIVNYTSTPALRMDIRIDIKYAEDIEKARSIATRTVSSTVGVLEQPAPVVLVEPDQEFVVLVLRFWTDSDRNRSGKVRSDIVQKLLEALRAAGIDYLHEVRESEQAVDREPGPGETQQMDKQY